MENLNAVFINDGMAQSERLIKPNQIAGLSGLVICKYPAATREVMYLAIFFCMIDNTDSFQNFPTCSWHATEVYYILLFIRQWHSFSVMVSVMVTMYSVMVFDKSVMVGV